MLPSTISGFQAPFHKERAYRQFEELMQGASNDEIRYVLQTFVNRQAEVNHRAMAVIPNQRFQRGGRKHCWSEIQPLLKSAGRFNSPMVMVADHPHMGLMVASSDKNADYGVEELPNGNIKVTVSLISKGPVALTTDIKELGRIGASTTSPFSKRGLMTDHPLRIIAAKRRPWDNDPCEAFDADAAIAASMLLNIEGQHRQEFSSPSQPPPFTPAPYNPFDASPIGSPSKVRKTLSYATQMHGLPMYNSLPAILEMPPALYGPLPAMEEFTGAL